MIQDINWQRIEKTTEMAPKRLAEFAGVTTNMYYSVKAGRRRLSNGNEFLLCLNLAIEADYQGEADLLRRARDLAEAYKDELL